MAAVTTSIGSPSNARRSTTFAANSPATCSCSAILRSKSGRVHEILEQERALATLRERERLARELHDGVTQLLAAAHLQVNTAKLLLTRGQETQLQTCLEALAVTTLQAEADLREYLLGVKSTNNGDRPLFAALRDYLGQFTRLYGIRVELTVPPILEEEGLPPAVEVQLVRIIQEALTNVRKHACNSQRTGSKPPEGALAPCRAWVTFALAGTQARLLNRRRRLWL